MPTNWQNTLQSTGQQAVPGPGDLRQLVLDFLCHNAFSNTARAFVKDSAIHHLDADGDEIMPSSGKDDTLDSSLERKLALGKLRKEIYTNILSGRIDEAIDMLNKHFPAVLSESSEHTAITRTEDALQYIPSTSVDPAHLALNLHIQAFIEAARWIPLPYYPPGMKRRADPQFLSTESTGVRKLSDDDTTKLLQRGQSLYIEAMRLPKKEDREMYSKELTHVSSILAYPGGPESSPSASYMAQKNREALADQIDDAILYKIASSEPHGAAKNGQQIISKLESAVRYTTVVWSVLQVLGVKQPPRNKWPAGITYPLNGDSKSDSTNQTSNTDGTPVVTKKPASENDASQVIPEFDLSAFLDAAP
ncbi:hypothetical protein WOLCODRAFT_135975 [Wolfiporia cocos MD-104 SS10]|uniref:CRA domain-containing protein n=1 Tax=Wolfiporia cocos (strain MD-104) TaxID=742152 RepID=A0A2H3JMW4_WOLCO|nr:hypothetical protein WOLCODRAFT_135975 [Wolfiporia cocos MD-104 SS10]